MADETAKKWDGDGVPLKDSNCALIGSQEDKDARKAAAATEEAWAGAGEKAGLQVWRIEDFKVVANSSGMKGKFHTGDSYIILETTQEEEDGALDYDIFFWLGATTSGDEMGTAAYKTVELDDLLDGRPTQHREVQGKESKQFRSLFPRIMYLEGGVDSGFNETVADTFEKRLFRVRKTKDGVHCQQVPLAIASMNTGDCFVLDAGRKIYLYQGPVCQPMEKYESNIMAERLETQRLGESEVTRDLDDEFWGMLGGTEEEIPDASEATDEAPKMELGEGVLYKITDASDELGMEEVGRQELTKDMLDSNEVMILDLQTEVYIWVGTNAPDSERRGAYRTAFNFLKVNGRDLKIPIHMLKEGNKEKNRTWNTIFAA